MIISEHNQIDKKTTQQRNWKSYIRIFWAYTIIQLSKTSKKKNTAKINRQKLFLVLNPANLCRVIV